MYELRELERNDIPAINEWRADRELIACLGAPYRYIGREVDEAWFDAYLKARPSTVRCAVVDSSCRSVILGLVTLASINWVARSAVLHIMVGREEDRGRGLGTFAVSEMLRHAFRDLGLHRVELDVLVGNDRAIHVYEKCGFQSEGIRREAVYKDGQWVDLCHMAVLAEWWEADGGTGGGCVPDERA